MLELLTERQRQVAVLISKGLRNKSIAIELEISPHTVKIYVSQILKRLVMTSRLELALSVKEELANALSLANGSDECIGEAGDGSRKAVA